jgi:hypothetical protein
MAVALVPFPAINIFKLADPTFKGFKFAFKVCIHQMINPFHRDSKGYCIPWLMDLVAVKILHS